uniref:CYAN/GREEN-EMITTING GFP-LIKE PROTEIN, KUSABIRA-CYAN MUTANT (KCY-R1) n=1 Tax=Lithophyllon concinna TaxID=1911064 RepID=UPI0001A48AB3
DPTMVSVIKPEMKMRYYMDGSVNGHEFTVEGEGTGRPYEGKQKITLDVTKGGPLPFAFDLLSTVFSYGNRALTKYPDDIPDYFKQCFPGGYSWERKFEFEDGGLAIAKAEISLKGNCFEHKSTIEGTFPDSSPIMQNKTLGWEPSTEKMTVRDGSMKGDDASYLKLVGGGNHKCYFTTTYTAKKKIPNLPGSHFIGHRISSVVEGTKIKVMEDAIAHLYPFNGS